jgi:hypothetical protein
MYLKETKVGPIGETLIIHDKYGAFEQKQSPKVWNGRSH